MSRNMKAIRITRYHKTTRWGPVYRMDCMAKKLSDLTPEESERFVKKLVSAAEMEIKRQRRVLAFKRVIYSPLILWQWINRYG